MAETEEARETKHTRLTKHGILNLHVLSSSLLYFFSFPASSSILFLIFLLGVHGEPVVIGGSTLASLPNILLQTCLLLTPSPLRILSLLYFVIKMQRTNPLPSPLPSPPLPLSPRDYSTKHLNLIYLQNFLYIRFTIQQVNHLQTPNYKKKKKRSTSQS